MTQQNSDAWKWIWPKVGTSPVSQNTDSEMFDRDDYPYTETFVREAIQNTLDARKNDSEPAAITFRFEESMEDGPRTYLSEAIKYREKASLSVDPEWYEGKVRWLLVEDSNTKGLDGDFDDRLGSFWGYWLNFGISNKTGQGRGGRGIGRVTFLIASKMQTVLGYTRRQCDGKAAACGMTLLRPMQIEGILRSTHAYLADSENVDKSVFNLHNGNHFHDELVSAFRLNGYNEENNSSGLALVIPFPHEDLCSKGIIASTIEHFAPAILSGALVVRADDQVLDSTTIDTQAQEVLEKIRTPWIKQDISRYLKLLRRGNNDAVHVLSCDCANANTNDSLADDPGVMQMRDKIQHGDLVLGQIKFELVRNNKSLPVSVDFCAQKTPNDMQSIDRFFREGMSLPDVRALNSNEIDLAIFVEDSELATYLNFCEGKAHLDLLESKEIRAKLAEKGYSPVVQVKRFVKRLPSFLRKLLVPEITEPETDVFDMFFSLPDASTNQPGRSRKEPEITPSKPDDLPPPKPPITKIKPLVDGFRVETNPENEEWPVNVSITVSYADGTRNPPWSKYDFQFRDLNLLVEAGDFDIDQNKITLRECDENSFIEVTGFDRRRELETRVKVWKNAQEN